MPARLSHYEAVEEKNPLFTYALPHAHARPQKRGSVSDNGHYATKTRGWAGMMAVILPRKSRAPCRIMRLAGGSGRGAGFHFDFGKGGGCKSTRLVSNFCKNAFGDLHD